MKKYQMASTMPDMSKSLPPSRTAPQFVVRFPDEEMRDRIKTAAEANGRSMNAEIVYRLAASLAEDAMTSNLSHDGPNDRAKGWAEHLTKTENRGELEELLSVVQEILARSTKK